MYDPSPYSAESNTTLWPVFVILLTLPRAFVTGHTWKFILVCAPSCVTPLMVFSPRFGIFDPSAP
eukprot:5791402-Karenia_brevis.AAC.1